MHLKIALVLIGVFQWGPKDLLLAYFSSTQDYLMFVNQINMIKKLFVEEELNDDW